MRTRVFRILLTVVLPVTAGAFIYLSWRSHTLLVFRWLHWIGLERFTEQTQHLAGLIKPPHLISNSVPDGLWVFAFTSAMRFVWHSPNSLIAFCWIALPTALALGGEFGQALQIVPGTFDWLDVFANLAGTTLAFCHTVELSREEALDINT